jgi:hypothetical protein
LEADLGSSSFPSISSSDLLSSFPLSLQSHRPQEPKENANASLVASWERSPNNVAAEKEGKRPRVKGRKRKQKLREKREKEKREREEEVRSPFFSLPIPLSEAC